MAGRIFERRKLRKKSATKQSDGIEDFFAPTYNISFPAKTSDYTLRDTDHAVLVDASDCDITISLPTVVNNSQMEFFIKRIDGSGNDVTIEAYGTQEIDEANSFDLTIQYEAVLLKCDGRAWWIF